MGLPFLAAALCMRGPQITSKTKKVTKNGAFKDDYCAPGLIRLAQTDNPHSPHFPVVRVLCALLYPSCYCLTVGASANGRAFAPSNLASYSGEQLG